MTDEVRGTPRMKQRRAARAELKAMRAPVSPATRVGRMVLAVAGMTLFYYVVPLDDRPSGTDLVTVILGMFLGLAGLVYVSVRQLRVLAHTEPGSPGVRLDVLALAVVVVVPLFALGYYALWLIQPEQFAGLATRTDALYFAVTTLATVGFGDVHAEGQLARVLVTVQMVFDLVFVALLVSIMGTEISARSGRRRYVVEAENPDSGSTAQR